MVVILCDIRSRLVAGSGRQQLSGSRTFRQALTLCLVHPSVLLAAVHTDGYVTNMGANENWVL
jgi:hypothetical protein